jgi:hippurate hydrolase
MALGTAPVVSRVRRVGVSPWLGRVGVLVVGLVLHPGAAASAADLRVVYRADLEAAVTRWVDEHLADLVATYKRLHANPELSLREHATAALVATTLGAAGYEVSTGVGGTGVVGVMRSGEGPTVLVRADMDALPVTEQTGLDYASTVTVGDDGGGTTGVMHACGHDVHVTSLLGTARLLASLRERWRGTVVMLGQPAEEVGKGALMMIEDGLFERFPRPDVTLALHVSHELPAGSLGYTPGWSAANVDSVDIVIRGRGGHGARPNEAIDPIVTAAHLITALQTLVSRRLDPTEPAVVTVGSIHGGTKHNVIPDEVALQLTVRSYSDEVRSQLLEGIAQLAADTCRTFRCPAPPTVTVKDEYTPAAYNDPALTMAAAEIFSNVLGEDAVVDQAPAMGGEDFGRYARYLEVPGFMFRLGTVASDAYEASLDPAGARLPALHSSTYAPDPEPSLRTGVRAMSTLVLAVLDAAAPRN